MSTHRDYKGNTIGLQRSASIGSLDFQRFEWHSEVDKSTTHSPTVRIARMIDRSERLYSSNVARSYMSNLSPRIVPLKRSSSHFAPRSNTFSYDTITSYSGGPTTPTTIANSSPTFGDPMSSRSTFPSPLQPVGGHIWTNTYQEPYSPVPDMPPISNFTIPTTMPTTTSTSSVSKITSPIMTPRVSINDNKRSISPLTITRPQTPLPHTATYISAPMNLHQASTFHYGEGDDFNLNDYVMPLRNEEEPYVVLSAGESISSEDKRRGSISRSPSRNQSRKPSMVPHAPSRMRQKINWLLEGHLLPEAGPISISGLRRVKGYIAPVEDDGFFYGDLILTVHAADGLPSNGGCYVRLLVDNKKGPRTKMIMSQNPSWSETFTVRLTGHVTNVTLSVKDEAKTIVLSDDIGLVKLVPTDFALPTKRKWYPLAGVANSSLVARTSSTPIPMNNLATNLASLPLLPTRPIYKVVNFGVKQVRQLGQQVVDFTQDLVVGPTSPTSLRKKEMMWASLCVSIKYIPAEVAIEHHEVKDSAFPPRSGCKVTLYQDAHVPSGTLPNIHLHGGLVHTPECAWLDIYEALSNAQYFIYITGWSLYTECTMKRDGNENETVGDLLKRKADEGVSVLIMLWNDSTSVDNIVVNTLLSSTKQGVASTFDEETRKYFKETNVFCKLVNRNTAIGGEGTKDMVDTMVSKVGSTAMFSHHQKSVMCDAPAFGDDPRQRRVVAYVGGFDLTMGRWDTPSHHLFHTLRDWHSGDFYNSVHPGFDPNFGPRLPWHDIHAKLEGRVAWDVVENFEQRWWKQVSGMRPHLVLHHMLPFVKPEEDIIPTDDPWTVQMFRSIDKSAAEGVPDVEPGIQNAYVHHIRRAEFFIYIETQYFLGSSKEWEGFDDHKFNVHAKHAIPIEIVTKIQSKIRNGERFAVYIVVPMHPEGIGDSAPVQGMLHWQFKTVEMMYKRVAKAIKQYGPSDAHPTDYLNIFCLGTRELGPKPANPKAIKEHLQRNIATKTRRHMIYVHSKMMIVDDEVIMVGSANINERSMAGDRDTEIAVAAYQDDYQTQTDIGPRLPTGRVSGFRQSLWGEHTNGLHPFYTRPDSVECVRHIRKMATENWAAYASEDQPLPHGHLMTYPYQVDANGNTSALIPYFPDSKASIEGSPQQAMALLTT